MPGYQPLSSPGPIKAAPASLVPAQEEFVPNTTDPQKVADVLPIWQWGGNPRGGAGETATTGDCPNCGSPRFFSKRQGGVTTANGVVYPNPECMDCGYPREQGQLGVASAIIAGGPSRQADAVGSWSRR